MSKSLTQMCADIIAEKDQKIADLEAKLAESEKEIKVIDEDRQFKAEMWTKFADKCKELEKQLAESEKKAYSRGHSQRDIDNEIKLNALREDVANKEKRIVELKKQLADKEKEIENIKLCRCVNCKNEYEFMLEGLVEDLEKQIDKDDQDKISFAITQLEKIKDKFREIYDKNRKHHLSVVKCYELVDEQIAELSNENKDNGE